MKQKKLTEEQKDFLAAKVDNEGFWYALNNGYLDPEDILDNKKDIKKVKEAIKIISEFEQTCPQY